MQTPILLVLANPSSPHYKQLARLPDRVRSIVTNDPARMREVAPEADAIFCADFFAAELQTLLPLATRARWVHWLFAGVEKLMTPELKAFPGVFTNGKGAFSGPLADWVAAVMLYYSFDFPRVLRQQQARVWEPFVSYGLEGRTLGILGYGGIGAMSAERARRFGMKVAALRRRPDQFAGDALLDATYGADQLDMLMAVSDYLLIAAPLTPETKGMVGEKQLAAMKSSAVLINLGRGPVVDEDALVRVLESNRIRGAALDVFGTEPLPSEHPFYGLPNVLLSPHTADRVEGFLDQAFDRFYENLELFLKGEPLKNVVDKNAGY